MREVPLHAARTLAAATPALQHGRRPLAGLRAASRTARARRGGSWSAWRTADDDDTHRSAAGGSATSTGSGTADAIRFRTDGQRHASACVLRLEPARAAPRAPALDRERAADHPALLVGRERGDPPRAARATPTRSTSRSCITPRARTTTRARSRRRSCAASRSTTCEGNGWNDIGYNLLVDKYGQVFEGRYGGVDRPVIGAHAEGFNTGSVGVAVIGDYTTTRLPAAAKTALEQVLAWRLDLAHVDPLSTLPVAVRRQPALPARRAGLPARDLGPPRHRLHRLSRATRCTRSSRRSRRTLQRSAARRSTHRPSRGKGEGQVRFTARLSVAQPWTVTVVNSVGVAGRAGHRHRNGRRLDVGRGARAARPLLVDDRGSRTRGRRQARLAPARRSRRAEDRGVRPRPFAPGETTTVSYTLTAAASVTVNLVSPAGATLATLLTAQKPAGLADARVHPAAGPPERRLRDRHHRDCRLEDCDRRRPARRRRHPDRLPRDGAVAELHAHARSDRRSRSRCCRARRSSRRRRCRRPLPGRRR